MNEKYQIIEIEPNKNLIDNSDCLRSSLSGFAYAKYLRRVQKCKDPIVFTSFLPVNDLLNQSQTGILTAIGHAYLQMPYSDQELDDILRGVNPLNDIQLNDIIINFCQQRSAVRESFHAFKGRIREIKNREINPIEKADAFIAEFADYEKELIKDVGNYPEIIKEYNRIIKLYNSTDDKSIELIEAVQEESFVSFLPVDEDSIKETTYEKKPWKVLFLDDKPAELESIFAVLKERKIGYEKAKSSSEAKEIIEADAKNELAVIVADYRLFEPNNDGWSKYKMQKEQGYDFLLWLSKQDRYNAMIALSGLSKWFLMDSFRQYQLNVKVYSKSGLLGGGAKLFVDDIEYLGNQYNNVVNSKPKALSWEFRKTKVTILDRKTNKTLDTYYISHKFNDLLTIEKINDKITGTNKKRENKKNKKDDVKIDKIRDTDHIVEMDVENYELVPYYIYHRNSSEYFTVENSINQQAEKVARELEFALDNSSVFNFSALVSIQGNATKTMKGEIEKEYPDFQLKLLQRRVFYYLILKGFDRDAISKMLHKGDSQSEMSESMIKAVPNMLAIQSETDIPYGLLVEEKHFLQHYMHLPIYNIAEMMDQTYSIINDVLSKYFKNNEVIAEALKNYCVENDNQIYFGTVSMNEVHIILKKIVDILLDQNNVVIAQDLISKIAAILNEIEKMIPDNKKVASNIKKIDDLIYRIQIRL
jgi:hypothetical protein